MAENKINEFLSSLEKLKDEDLKLEKNRANLKEHFNEVIFTTIGNNKISEKEQKNINLILEEFEELLTPIPSHSKISGLPISVKALNMFVFVSRAIAKNLESDLTEQKTRLEEMAAKALALSEKLIKGEEKQIQQVTNIDARLPQEIVIEQKISMDSYKQLEYADILYRKLYDNILNGYEGEDPNLVKERLKKFRQNSGDKAIEAIKKTIFSPLDSVESDKVNSKVARSELIRSSLDKLESIIKTLNSRNLMRDFWNFREEVSKVRFKELKKNKIFNEELKDHEELINKLRMDHRKIRKIDLSPKAILNEYISLVKNSNNLDQAKKQLKYELMRTIASSIYDTPEKVKNNIAYNAMLEVAKNAKNDLNGIELTKETKDKLIKGSKDQIEQDDNNISIKERVYRERLEKIMESKINPIIDKAFEKIEKDPDSKEIDKLIDKKRSWYNVAGKIYDSLAVVFREVSLLLGAEKNAKELFESLAKTALNEKNLIDKDNKRKNNIMENSISKNSKSYEELYKEYKNYLKDTKIELVTREEEARGFTSYIRNRADNHLSTLLKSGRLR